MVTLVVFLFLPVFQSSASVVTPIKILLVPGHDTEVWGAQYGNIKEADMTLALATQIFNILKKDKRFEVYITRDATGYTKEFTDYFSNNQKEIIAFKTDAHKKFKEKISNGIVVKKVGVLHNAVSKEVSVDLYGINKWANENKMDAVIHIHFNDYPRKTKWTIGKYTGFNIYTPDMQLTNSKKSLQLATDVLGQLKKKYATSTYKPEMGGLTFDQNLIALGSSDTLLSSVRSVLIEYGYIYEKKFRTKDTRLLAYKNMANLTVQGIEDYFFKK